MSLTDTIVSPCPSFPAAMSRSKGELMDHTVDPSSRWRTNGDELAGVHGDGKRSLSTLRSTTSEDECLVRQEESTDDALHLSVVLDMDAIVIDERRRDEVPGEIFSSHSFLFVPLTSRQTNISSPSPSASDIDRFSASFSTVRSSVQLELDHCRRLGPRENESVGGVWLSSIGQVRRPVVSLAALVGDKCSSVLCAALAMSPLPSTRFEEEVGVRERGQLVRRPSLSVDRENGIRSFSADLCSTEETKGTISEQHRPPLLSPHRKNNFFVRQIRSEDRKTTSHRLKKNNELRQGTGKTIEKIQLDATKFLLSFLGEMRDDVEVSVSPIDLENLLGKSLLNGLKRSRRCSTFSSLESHRRNSEHAIDRSLLFLLIDPHVFDCMVRPISDIDRSLRLREDFLPSAGK